MISGHTKAFALFGPPVEHSLSPAMHNAPFAELGLDCVHLYHDVVPSAISAAVVGARVVGFVGFNVTIPCKVAVTEHLDELSPAAWLMGAVNTVRHEGDRFIGYNTDGAGLLRSVAERGFDVAGVSIAVIGADGVGSVAYTQTTLDGAGRVSVPKRANVSFGPVSQRIAAPSERMGVSPTLTDVADEAVLERVVREAGIVVDAIRVGMAPLESQSNAREEWLRPDQAVADTVYHPCETKLLAPTTRAGATPIDGLGMLLWQATIAEEIRLDAAMSVDRVREAVFEG